LSAPPDPLAAIKGGVLLLRGRREESRKERESGKEGRGGQGRGFLLFI